MSGQLRKLGLGLIAGLMASTAAVASPSDTPGAVLKLMVAAGNWPWWRPDSGAAVNAYARKARAAGDTRLIRYA